MGDVIPRIEAHLQNIEANLVSRAASLGEEFLSAWTSRLKQAYSEAPELEQRKTGMFTPNVARDNYWLRIEVTDKSPQELIKEISTAVGASTKPLDDQIHAV